MQTSACYNVKKYYGRILPFALKRKRRYLIDMFFTFVYDYIFILQIAAVSLSLLIVFYPFQKTFRSIAFAAAQFAALFALGTVLNWGLFELSSVWTFLGGINFHISWLLVIIIYLLFNRVYLMSRMIMGAVLYTSVIAVTDLGRLVMNVLPVGTDWSFVNILFYLLIIGFSLLIRRYTLTRYSDIPVFSVAMIMLGAICSSSLIIGKTILNVKIGGISQDTFFIFTLAVIYILIVSSYMIIYFHCKGRKEVIELQVKNKLLEADKQMLAVSEQAISEMRQIKHDIKNQLKVIELMLEQKQYGALGRYFSSMNESFLKENGSSFIDCGNEFINSVINMEILKANNYGIQLVTRINVPSELPFEKSDLCRILVNLLDNAIEGVLRADSKDYLVDCKIARQAGFLYVSVQNHIRDDYDRDRLLEMNTEKEDADNHGFGHRIVKRIVEKYNGIVKYKVEDNEFIAEMMLDFTSMEVK